MRTTSSSNVVAAVVAAIALVTAACEQRSAERAAPAKPETAAVAKKAASAPSAEAAAVIAEQLPKYPLRVCPVSGKELGSMGDPYNHVHEGRLVRFCCDGCIPEFNEDPALHLAKIDAAAAAGAGGSH
jgi:hypothetical protein